AYLARTCLILGCLIGGLLTLKPSSAQQEPGAAPAERKVFKDSVVPLPPPGNFTRHGIFVQAVKPGAQDQKMEILFSLAVPKEVQKDIEARVAKGQIIPPKELAEKYSAKQEDSEKLEKWLKDQGFEITKTTPNHTSVYAKATVAQ